MKTIKVLKANSFCIEKSTYVLGISDGSSFASAAWNESDELFHATDGTKFSWIAPDGNSYTDHRDNFQRPTEEEIIGLISAQLQDMAVEKGLIEIEVIRK